MLNSFLSTIEFRPSKHRTDCTVIRRFSHGDQRNFFNLHQSERARPNRVYCRVQLWTLGHPNDNINTVWPRKREFTIVGYLIEQVLFFFKFLIGQVLTSNFFVISVRSYKRLDARRNNHRGVFFLPSVLLVVTRNTFPDNVTSTLYTTNTTTLYFNSIIKKIKQKNNNNNSTRGLRSNRKCSKTIRMYVRRNFSPEHNYVVTF